MTLHRRFRICYLLIVTPAVIEAMFIQHFSILRGFASVQPTKSLTWPWDISTAETHDFLLRSILLNQHFLSYPPSKQYQRGFWKWAIENMERKILRSQPEACASLSIRTRISVNLET